MRPCVRRGSSSVANPLEELRRAERDAVANRLLVGVDPHAPWFEDLRALAGAFADELEKLQTRPEPGSRFVVVYEEE